MSVQNFSPEQMIDLYKKDYGIHFTERDGYNSIVCDSDRNFKNTAQKMAMDVDTYSYNPSSSGVPAWMTLINLNKVVDQLLIVRRYMEIGEPMQFGNFASQTAQYGLIGLTGQVEPYSDFSGTLTSDVNATFPVRDVFRGQTLIQYGELEVATMSEAKIDVISKKQYSAAMQIAITQNKFFFYGNLNASSAFITQTFGILNDPGLNAATPATNGQSSGPSWATKSASASGAVDIAQDVIVTAYKVMQTQMGGNINIDDEFMLCCSTTAAPYLNTTNSFGLTAIDIIKKSIPNIKFVFAPEYATIGSFQLIATKSLGENLVKDLFTYKARGHGIVRTSSTSFDEKWSFGTAGCAILQYAPIVTISGIE